MPLGPEVSVWPGVARVQLRKTRQQCHLQSSSLPPRRSVELVGRTMADVCRGRRGSNHGRGQQGWLVARGQNDRCADRRQGKVRVYQTWTIPPSPSTLSSRWRLNLDLAQIKAWWTSAGTFPPAESLHMSFPAALHVSFAPTPSIAGSDCTTAGTSVGPAVQTISMCLEPPQFAASEFALGPTQHPIISPLLFAESAARRRTPSPASTLPQLRVSFARPQVMSTLFASVSSSLADSQAVAEHIVDT
ncbi:hypothetical protein DFH09DRAFT_71986 [Mycena vulgaris]|nr:hypothetical protein DFH09DRAFT_71986 [Mycena vulgaris]